jgi:hypothetical protein
MGFDMGFSAQVASHTKGAGTGYLINNASGYAAGATTLAVDGGTVNTTGIKAGDVISIADDPSAARYIVGTGLTAVSGNLEINDPGLAGAVLGNSYAANMFFHRNALMLVARAPAMPVGGDAADDVMTVTDPISGLTFQVAVYKQYRQVKYEVGLAWGVAAPNGKHAGVLLG